MTKINLKVPYTQSVPQLKIKNKTLLYYISDNMSVFDFIDTIMPKLKVYVPNIANSMYIQKLSTENKKLMIRNESIFKTLRPVIYDVNSVFYKLNYRYENKSKLDKKFLELFNAGLESLNVNKYKRINYEFIGLVYGIDVTNKTTKMNKSDLKYLILSSIAYFIKNSKEPFIFKNIILTIKTGNMYSSILIYDGKTFNFEKVLTTINHYIDLNKKLQNTTGSSNTFTIEYSEVESTSNTAAETAAKKFNLKSDEEKEVVKQAIINYIESHPDAVVDKDKIKYIELVNLALVNELENQEIKVNPNNIKTVIKTLIQQIPEPIIAKPQTTTEEVFNGTFKTGNVLNFRKSMFDENLKNQIKIFSKYYKEKYGLDVTKIKIKKGTTKSVFKTTYSTITLTVKDPKNKKSFDITFDLPDMSDKNYIKQDGIKRVLVYQLYQYPIASPMPFSSMLKTNYTTVEIKSKNINKNKGLTIYISGKEIPLLSYILNLTKANCDKIKGCSKTTCFESALKLLKGKYKTSDDESILNKTKYSFKFNKKIYYVEELGDIRTQQLFWSFKQEAKKLNIDSCDSFSREFELEYGIRYRDNIIQVDQYIIDPITEYILISEKKSTKTINLYNECIDNAISGITINPTSLNHKRIRSSESLAILIFKKLTPIINEYHHKKSKEIKVNKNAVINDLMAGDAQSQFQTVNDKNPLIESSMSDLITQGGYKGLSTEFAKSEVRMGDISYYGNIDPLHTPDSGAVGVVRHVAVNANILNSSGKFLIKSEKEKVNPFSMANNYSPGPVHNDGNRIQYAAAQMQSDIPIVDPDLPVITSIYSSGFSRVVSDDFTVKAPKKGKVLDVREDGIIIKYNDEKKPRLISSDKYNMHGNKDLITTQEPVVKKGDTFKGGDILFSSKEFFIQNNLALGKNLYTLLKPHKYYNFEDGIVISEQCAGKLASHHGDQVVVNLKSNEIITTIAEEQQEVEPNKPILIKTASLSESDIIIDLGNRLKPLLEFDDEDFDTLSEPDIPDPNSDSASPTVGDDSDENSFSDNFSTNIYPHLKGTIFEIQIFAKNKQELAKHPTLEKMRNEKLIKLDQLIKSYKSEGIDASSLEEKYNEIYECFGKHYKGNPIESVLIIFKIHGLKGLKIGDKMHNRHGKHIAA